MGILSGIPDGQRRAAGVSEDLAGGGFAGERGFEGYLFEDKGLLDGKQPVHGLHQPGLAPPVSFQGVPGILPNLPGGVQIREDVRAPEAVDGLFRIADKEERRTGKYRAEDLVLNRIGILELVDQGCTVSLREVFLQGRAVVRGEAVTHLEQQVVEVNDPELILLSGEMGSHVPEHLHLEPDEDAVHA